MSTRLDNPCTSSWLVENCYCSYTTQMRCYVTFHIMKPWSVLSHVIRTSFPIYHHYHKYYVRWIRPKWCRGNSFAINHPLRRKPSVDRAQFWNRRPVLSQTLYRLLISWSLNVTKISWCRHSSPPTNNIIVPLSFVSIVISWRPKKIARFQLG